MRHGGSAPSTLATWASVGDGIHDRRQDSGFAGRTCLQLHDIGRPRNKSVHRAKSHAAGGALSSYTAPVGTIIQSQSRVSERCQCVAVRLSYCRGARFPCSTPKSDNKYTRTLVRPAPGEEKCTFGILGDGAGAVRQGDFRRSSRKYRYRYILGKCVPVGCDWA